MSRSAERRGKGIKQPSEAEKPGSASKSSGTFWEPHGTSLGTGFYLFFSPIAMLWGLAKLIGGQAPSGHRQSWWADGVPVMF